MAYSWRHCLWPRRRLKVLAVLLVCLFLLAQVYLKEIGDRIKNPRDVQDPEDVKLRSSALPPTFLRPVAPEPTDSASVRHLEVRDRCKKRGLGTAGRSPAQSPKLPVFQMSPAISTKHEPNLFYCPLAKAGSTYFTRYMISLDKPGTMVSPYNISIQDAGRATLQRFNSIKGGMSQKLAFLANSFRFLFVRNPFTRIFSAYIDKLYSPNPHYWQAWGKPAIARGSLSRERHPCGANTPFPEFLKLVVSLLYKRDLHFITMYSMCRVCDIEWNMVGQLEHIFPDVDYLSSKINVSSAYQYKPGYSAASARDVIIDATTNAFGDWSSEVDKCISLYDAGRTIWRTFQIRGIIYKDARFPFSVDEMKTMNATRFQEACFHAARQATDRKRLKRQKQDALREAYESADQEDVNALLKIYANDFYLFDYSTNLTALFATSEAKAEHKNILDFREPWL